MATHGIIRTHGIMPHGRTTNTNGGAVEISRKKVPELLTQNSNLYE
jgi:hypothetical protein